LGITFLLAVLRSSIGLAIQDPMIAVPAWAGSKEKALFARNRAFLVFKRSEAALTEAREIR
jgi:hypothetical protein